MGKTEIDQAHIILNSLVYTVSSDIASIIDISILLEHALTPHILHFKEKYHRAKKLSSSHLLNDYIEHSVATWFGTNIPLYKRFNEEISTDFLKYTKAVRPLLLTMQTLHLEDFRRLDAQLHDEESLYVTPHFRLNPEIIQRNPELASDTTGCPISRLANTRFNESFNTMIGLQYYAGLRLKRYLQANQYQ